MRELRLRQTPVLSPHSTVDALHLRSFQNGGRRCDWHTYCVRSCDDQLLHSQNRWRLGRLFRSFIRYSVNFRFVLSLCCFCIFEINNETPSVPTRAARAQRRITAVYCWTQTLFTIFLNFFCQNISPCYSSVLVGLMKWQVCTLEILILTNE